MALQKTQLLDNGVEISYHKITSLQYFEGRPSLVEISSYISKEAKDAGKLPVDKKSFDINGLDKTNLVGSAYTVLTKSNKVNGELITPAVTEVVPEVLNEDGTVNTPETIKEITPAVYEEIETNFFSDSINV